MSNFKKNIIWGTVAPLLYSKFILILFSSLQNLN